MAGKDQMKRTFLLFFATERGLKLVGAIIALVGGILLFSDKRAASTCELAAAIIVSASGELDLPSVQRRVALLGYGSTLLLIVVAGLSVSSILGVVCFIAAGVGLFGTFGYVMFWHLRRKKPEKEQSKATWRLLNPATFPLSEKPAGNPKRVFV
jgi:hypothetical protein